MLYVNDEPFGPSRRMFRPVAERSRGAWIRSRGTRWRPKSMPWKRVKWLWVPEHVKQTSTHRAAASNRHFLQQRERMVASIRPAHMRKRAKR